MDDGGFSYETTASDALGTAEVSSASTQPVDDNETPAILIPPPPPHLDLGVGGDDNDDGSSSASSSLDPEEGHDESSDDDADASQTFQWGVPPPELSADEPVPGIDMFRSELHEFVNPSFSTPELNAQDNSHAAPSVLVQLLLKLHLAGKFTHRQMELIIDSFQVVSNVVCEALKHPQFRLRLDRKWFRYLAKASSAPVISSYVCPNDSCKSTVFTKKSSASASDSSASVESTKPINCTSCGSVLLTDAGNSREMTARIPLKSFLDVAMQVPEFKIHIDNPPQSTSTGRRTGSS